MLRPLRCALALLATATPFVASCSSGTVNVYMALDSDGARKRTTFYTDTETIVCIAEVPAGQGGITVNAVIRRISDGHDGVNEVIGVSEQVASSQSGGGGAPKVPFVVPKSASGTTTQDDVPWPVGAFQCEISVDGTLKGVAPFSIEMPDCPVYLPATGMQCGGFYRPDGPRCPAANQFVGCTCSGRTGLWECS